MIDSLDIESNPFDNLNVNNSCRHVTLSDYNACFSGCSNDFSLLNINLQSYHAKSTKLEGFLAAVHDDFNCLVLTETWNHKDNVNFCNILNYSGIHTYRTSPLPLHGGIGGGVSIFADSSKHNIAKIDDLSFCNNTIETCVAKVSSKISNNVDDLIVIAVYRPHTDTIDNFNIALNNILCNTILCNKTVIIAGDMNINLTDDDVSTSIDYLTMLQSYNYLPVITKPTRFPTDSNSFVRASTIDHIFLNKLVPFDSLIFWNDFSDHCPTVLRLESFMMHNNNDMLKTFSFRPYSDANFNKLENKMYATNWTSLLSSSDVNTQFNKFLSYLDRCYCDSFPLKTKTISEKRQKNSWVSGETLQMIRLKSNYHKLFINGIISRAENNRLRNKMNKKIEKDKKLYFRNLFENARNNMKKSWGIIRSLSGINSNKSDYKKIFEEAPPDESHVDTLNRFNNFFSTIGERLSSDLNSINNFEPSPQTHNSNNFYLFPPNQSEILNIISNLKITKTHLNSMPVRIFKSLKNILVIPVLILLNNSFTTGIFPDSLKVARITPIHKNGNFTTPNNFRPISSLPFMSKIYEKFIARRLLKFLAKYKILSPKQFGFQSGISTCDALINLTEEIYRALDNKEHYISTLVDIKKAFDCVDHAILLKKLENYGIRGLPLDWFKSYLKDRKCYLEMNGIISNENTFNISVPQGSILGPVLFLIHINHLPAFSTLLDCQMFADDTVVSYSGSDISEVTATVTSELDKLSNWMCENKLTLNPSKTEMLLVSNRIHDQNNLSISFCNENISFSPSCKYLGVYLDHKLNFKVHIEHVTKTIARYTGILYKIKQYLPLKARLNYYYGYIYPYLNYNILIWGGTNASTLKPLITQHKRSVRTIVDADFRAHTDPIFKTLNLLKIEDTYKLNLFLYVYKARLRGEFQRIHNLNTRDSNLANPTFHRLNQTQRAVSYAGPTIWNELPPYLREIENFGRFKFETKKFFISRYDTLP